MTPTLPKIKKIVDNEETLATTIRYQIIETNELDIIDKLYISYLESKSTQMVRQNKNIMAITKKFEEVHTDFLRLHNPPSQSDGIHSAILICKYIHKF